MLVARLIKAVSTHSRAEAAATRRHISGGTDQFQHTAARRRLQPTRPRFCLSSRFQHTAARRRLLVGAGLIKDDNRFQHTAARRRLRVFFRCFDRQYLGFNTQPRGGGC